MESIRTLPGDDVRQIMWRFADRFDLQMAVQSSRSVARGIVARLVADGARNSHDWNENKAQLLDAFDQAGLTSIFMEPEYGGFIEGPKNLALSLLAYELAWVDAGAGTCSMASFLALSPIHERGTPEQRDRYMKAAVPPQPGEDRVVKRGAFALTEPIPYVGVDTGVLVGKARVAEWEEGKEPMLQIDKRGRFITNMPFADFVVAAVDTADERIKTSCMVILEKGDPGTWDPGSNTLKMVHQLSATSDPVLNLTVPAERIVGGYTIQDGVIIPNYSHGEVIAAVFSHTRVTVGLMTASKLLSAVEPVIRYQRQRFRGGEAAQPGTPRFELGLQQKDDALQRLVDVWATGEVAASLGFAASRVFDEIDPLEKEKDRVFAEQDIPRGRKQFMALRKKQKEALEYIELEMNPEGRDEARFQELGEDILVRYALAEAEGNVLCPACKLWNTGWGSVMMREALSLMGGYGITEDCPGFLGQKWFDTQLEAIYEGPEAVQRRQISATMTNEIFLARMRQWIEELKDIARKRPGLGACALASGFELWLQTYELLQAGKDPNGKPLFHGKRHGVTFPLADALCWLLAPRYFLMDVLELEEKGPMNPVVAEGLEGLLSFFFNLFTVQSARSASEVARICTELAYGYATHPECDSACCKIDTGEHGQTFEGAEQFQTLRGKLDQCLAGARLAKDCAAQALTQVMIPEALDYPL